MKRRQLGWFKSWWFEWGPLTLVGVVVLLFAFGPMAYAVLHPDPPVTCSVIDPANLQPQPVLVPEEQRVADIGDINGMVDSLLPLYTLPNGEPLKRPTVEIQKDKQCDPMGYSVSAFSYQPFNAIVVCEHTAKHPHDRLVRVLKHELVHIWIYQSNIHEKHSHGIAFMKKALEVGTTVIDEPDEL